MNYQLKDIFIDCFRLKINLNMILRETAISIQ